MAGVCLLRKKQTKNNNLSWILLTSFFPLKFNHNFFPPLTILSNVSQVPLHSDTFRKAFGKMFKQHCWCIRCIIIMSQLGQYHFIKSRFVLFSSWVPLVLQILFSRNIAFTHPCEVIDATGFAITNGQKRSMSFLGLLV